MPQVTAVLLVIAAVLVGVGMAGVLVTAYWPVSARRRAALRGKTLHHYRKAEHLVHNDDGTVGLTARRKRQLLWFGVMPVTATFFYVGRNGRGGRFNHASIQPDDRFVRVDVRGADFLEWAGERRLSWRPWDRALAVRAEYRGPAVVVDGVHPVTDRRSLV